MGSWLRTCVRPLKPTQAAPGAPAAGPVRCKRNARWALLGTAGAMTALATEPATKGRVGHPPVAGQPHAPCGQGQLGARPLCAASVRTRQASLWPSTAQQHRLPCIMRSRLGAVGPGRSAGRSTRWPASTHDQQVQLQKASLPAAVQHAVDKLRSTGGQEWVRRCASQSGKPGSLSGECICHCSSRLEQRPGQDRAMFGRHRKKSCPPK